MQQPSVFDIIAHTPTWVWAALVLVIWLGFRRAQDREVTTSRLVLFPLIVVVLALSGLVHAGMGPATLEGFGVGVLTGGFAGVALDRRNMAVRLASGKLFLKGEWTSLAVVVAIFVSRYVTTAVSTLDPATAAGGAFQFVTALVSGFFCAMMVVRTGLRLRVAMA